jgi:biotin operon repressor
MPTIEAIRDAVATLEAAGEHPSVEKIRQRLGGSPRDILHHLRTLRGETAPRAATGA